MSTNATQTAGKLTSIHVLLHRDPNTALVLLLGRLRRKLRAVAKVTATVHRGLERVALPAEDVVGMLAETGPFPLLDAVMSAPRIWNSSLVSSRKHERLAAVLGPIVLVVERSRVPVYLFLCVNISLCLTVPLRAVLGMVRTSNISCGILTGWLAGQVPVTTEKDGGVPVG